MKKQILFTVLLISSIAATLGMQDPSHAKNGRLPLKNFHRAPEFESYFGQPESPRQRPPMYTEQFDEATIKEMKQVLKSAPIDAQNIIHHLKDTGFLKDVSWRVSVFWGAPGTGKTSTALAIAHEMLISRQWKHRFFSSGNVAEKDRNATAVRLRKVLEEIEADKTPTILIIDEMNELLENTESKNHDTNTTSNLLWTFLDRQLSNPNFFCIGTMNRVHLLAEPFKSRYSTDFILFPLLANPLLKAAILRAKLINTGTSVAAHVTDEQISALLQPLPHCEGRDLKKISCLCKKMICRRRPISNDELVVDLDILTRTIEEFRQQCVHLQVGRIQETDEEQRERHHREQQTLQIRLAETGFALQAEAERMKTNIPSDPGNPYCHNYISNNLHAVYYNNFPERRPANYQPLPENRAEADRQAGRPAEGSCVLQ